MKRLFQLSLVLFSLCLTAQTNSIKNSPALIAANPSSQGMSPERLDRIDLMLKNEISKDNLPGAVALIARNGKVVFHEAYGMANSEKGKEMEKDAIFRIASQTKAITATAVMILWEEGKFKLDDPISKYIPQFEAAQILDTFNEADSTYTTKPAENQITIRDLITHTSGIGYGMIDGDERFRKIYAKAGIIDAFTSKKILIGDNIKKLATLPLHHEPGEAWTYSEGLDVLGYLIEIVSGMPFDEFLSTRIFEPLQMNDTYFYLPKEKADRLVSVQYKDGNKWKNFSTPVFEIDYPNSGGTFFSGGAGLSSTAKDYATFLQMYLNGGELNGKRLLSRTTVYSILSNQIGTIWDGGKDYGLAFEIVNEKGAMSGGEGSEGTFSWGGYFNTQYFADPQENIIGIIMKQTQGPVNDYTGWKFRQMVFTAIDD
ncbi:serine hydrolase [Maribacter sp. PR1]|uniref:Serine hydrolase domain-containing protein n=1 Tax=Maribacter cobaltidurans TaxID=1178778 RepID=A0ABU7IPX1_9FLAO|nr:MULTISPECIES: serine hydrolase domain-containing protein [Maribacter]MDC6387617.1 serine hydrolase [Maribacter sp. PR1]MEE1975005.1 serine hydrolase domain-containing protein [Maribacter cobaltidurans]